MKKNILKNTGIGIVLGLSLLMPFLVMAQQSQNGLPGPIITTPANISQIISKILGWIAGIVFTISLIMLLYAAILFLTAGASETAHGKAKSVLIYAIVGLTVAILALSVQPFLVNFFRGAF